MPTYFDLLLTILPVFAIIALGVGVRQIGWVGAEGETSLLKLVVNLLFPCLIYHTVAGNTAFREPANVLWPPLIGFAFTAAGIGLCFYAGRAIGLTTGHGLRTFALTAGICNYGYLPLPIAEAMWGRESQGLVLVHNIGVEVALWTVGVLVLSGLSPREGWRRLLNPIVFAMFVTLILNAAGIAQRTPGPLLAVARALGACAVPLGLLMVGINLATHLGSARALVNPRVSLAACALRLGVIPILMLGAIRYLPVSPELKRVLVLEAAMPSAVFPIVLARLYGGHPLTAVQVALATTLVGILTIPFWIRAGLAWIA